MGKRANGEGSITRYKDGRWCGRYTVHTVNGPKRKALYGRTKAEVRVKLTKAMADADNGLHFDAGNQTVEEHLGRWLEDSAKGNVGQRTFPSYRAQIAGHIVPTLGHIKLKTLAPAHVQGFYRSKLDAGLAPSSARIIRAVLHRALKQAVRWGLVPRNVTEAVDIPKLVREEVNALSPEEARRFLAAARGEHLEALYVVAVHCELRRDELLGLRWSDVDLDAGTLRVNRQLQRMRDGSGFAFSPPKNNKARRTIRLTHAASDATVSVRRRRS
jgi:integrase